jgi:hypothetical protein
MLEGGEREEKGNAGAPFSFVLDHVAAFLNAQKLTPRSFLELWAAKQGAASSSAPRQTTLA